MLPHVLWWVLLTCECIQAQFPKTPQGITVLHSQFDENIKISYKETHICETTPGVRSFAGYVHLPPHTASDSDLGLNQSYPINTFFWYFEARKDPQNAPLSLWLNGGPGSSSLLGLFAENGPCLINPDSTSTTLNKWSWNNEVNMLYIDQPNQVGLSYDTLRNVTYDILFDNITTLEDTSPIPEQNATFKVGTFPSGDGNNTARGTVAAAADMWHFLQVWTREFPEYRTSDSRINLATESYGGRYGPEFFYYFQKQNEKIAATTCSNPCPLQVLDLDTLLIVNGCIDRVQHPLYPQMANNNTYGIKAVNQTTYDNMTYSYAREGGCKDQLDQCDTLSLKYDPSLIGINDTVNKVCSDASEFCADYVRRPYFAAGRSNYDITLLDPSTDIPPWYQGYMQNAFVQDALGVPLNWSQHADQVGDTFDSMGDLERPGMLGKLAYLLDQGIKVQFMYGDRDYICNWIGGEAVSLAINYTDSSRFQAAGYTPIQTNDSYIGGQVRQYGNFSFARVYQARHGVPGSQPETAWQIFTRALRGRDIATGKHATSATGKHATSDGADVYSSKGTSSSWQFKNKPPAQQPLGICYTWILWYTCTDSQLDALYNGTALVQNFILVDKNATQLYPEVVGGGDMRGIAFTHAHGKPPKV